MEIFLNVMQALSDSRVWALPILLICTVVALALEIMTTVQEEIDEWPHAKAQRRKVKGIQGGADDEL